MRTGNWGHGKPQAVPTVSSYTVVTALFECRTAWWEVRDTTPYFVTCALGIGATENLKLSLLYVLILWFNLSIISAFYLTDATWTLQIYDLSEEGINFRSHKYFFDHTRTWKTSPNWGSAQCWGHLQHNTNMKDDTHNSRSHSFQQGEHERMIITAKWLRGPCGPKASSHLSYRWGKTLKNLTQKTCPRSGIEPGPLRDGRACYRLLHSDGLL